MRGLRSIGVVAIAAAAGLVAAACGGSSSPSSNSSSSKVLTISNESGAEWTCGFNPFNSSVSWEIFGPVYEPLVFVDSLENQKTTPWLATKWTWSDGNKVITFTIRNGVKFTNGSTLTAADVAGTFNLLKKFPALDVNAVWTVLKSVVQQGNNVVFTFKTAAVPYFYYIADQVPIVPISIWSKLKNPVTFNDPSPVATGPYTTSCTPEQITFHANPHYWQPGLPKIKTVDYPAFTSNDPANTELATGQAQWGGQYIPSINSFYKSKSPDNHYWFPPVANVSLFINLKNPLLSNVAVREAMAYAIDRSKVSTIGESGYEPASNQTGIVTPTYSTWEDTSEAAAFGNYAYNPAKAESILTKAGFKKNSSGIFVSPSGKPLSFSVVNNGGFSDWVAAMQVIISDMKAVGIQLTPLNLSGTDFDTRVQDGDFDLAYDSESGGPSPYYEMRQWLYSGNTAAIGKPASTNYERYSNPATDNLFDEYAVTTSTTMQHSIIDQLQEIMLKDVPVIPVTEEVDWYQYSTANFTGWETPSNAYAQPAPYNNPDFEVTLLHLRPKS
jgi:peptide/nickel transport system substrate-binding protein